jgi:hypothetical protein
MPICPHRGYLVVENIIPKYVFAPIGATQKQNGIKLCNRSNDETYKNGTNITKEMIEAKKPKS